MDATFARAVLASRLRRIIDALSQLGSDLDDARLVDAALELVDPLCRLSQTHADLVELLCQGRPPAPATSQRIQNGRHRSPQLPF